MKKSLKRKVALLLTAAMLVPSAAFANAGSSGSEAVATSTAVSGSDVSGHWAEQDFTSWYGKQLIAGYSDGTFKPNQAITRAEFVTLLDRVFNFADQSEVRFKDLSSSDFSYEAFAKAAAAGIIKGYSDGSVHPNAPISREEAAVLLFRSYELKASAAASKLTDAASLTAWSKEAVLTLVNGDYVNGYPDGTFRGDSSITRAEAIRMLNNLSGEIVNQAGTYTKLDTRNMVINTPDVVLQNTVIEGDLYLTQGIAEGDVRLDNVTVKGTVHVYGGGENSIKLNDSAIKSIVIDKKNGKIRVVAQGDTKAEQVFVISGAMIIEENAADGAGFGSIVLDEGLSANAVVQLEGSFDGVEVRAITEPELRLLSGIINNLRLQQKASLHVDEKGEVKEVVIPVDTTITVTGKGKVNASKPEDKKKLAFEGGTTSTTPTTPTNPTDPTNPGPAAPLDSVAIVEPDLGLRVGEEQTLTLQTSPAQAPAGSVNWTSSNEAVATVDANGFVTALAAGTAVIKAAAVSDAAKFDTATVTVSKVTFANTSVHDPSIVVDKDTGTYYVFGSHIETAKSNDLMNWTKFTNGYTTPNNVMFGDLSANLAESFDWAGENDSDSKGGFAVWAPFVLYNEDYVNTDGSKGAYVMYYSTSSTYIRSAIGYAVSQNIEGPYTYVDTIMYSGFTQNDAQDANSTVNKKWTNTNIPSLITDGKLQGERSEWFNANGSYNNGTYPNAIDPALFYDTDGKLWMMYGSWSGGIFALEIDKATGAAIYPGADGTTSDGRLIDRYFGTKVAGGYGQSGEGPYVVYDKKTGYYFLNVTYGWLGADGGYNMRMFRSTSPSGPYVDAQGNSAVLPAGGLNDDYGNKMIGNYLFERLTGDPGTGIGIGYMSPGHNSVYIDEQTGEYFLIFHARFPQQGEGHEVRVHQMFLNKDNWPIVSPYRYSGETLEKLTEQAIVGEYKFINHGKATTGALTKSTFVQLNADHTVTGDATGSWSLVGDNQAAITVDGVTYDGVFVREWDGTSERVVMTFTAMSQQGITIWGSRLSNKTDAEIVADVLDGIDIGDVNNVVANLKLPTAGTRHSSITWQTSDASVVSGTGVVTRPESNESAATVVLTATVTKGGVTDSKSFTITVQPKLAAKLTANYTFEGDLNDTTGTYAAGTVSGNKIDAAGGTITYAAGKYGNAAIFDGNSGVRLPDGLIHNNNYSISFWVKPDVLTDFTTAFFGAKDTDNFISIQPKGWSGTMLWGRSVAAGGTVNWYDAVSGMTIKANEWSHVAVSVENGAVTLYVNGVAKYTGTNFPDQFTGVNGVFSLGVNWWDIPFKGMIDDLKIYDGILTPQEVNTMVFDPSTKIDEIQLSFTEKRVSVGGTAKPSAASISVTPKFAGNQQLVWSVADPTVAQIDGSTGWVTGLAVGSTTVTAASTDGSNKTTSYTLHVLDGAIAHYSFEGNLQDSTGYGAGTVTGNKATNTGGTITYAAGVNGQAAVFNGTSGVRLPDGLISGNSYTVSMSVYLDQGKQFTPAFFGAATSESWISLVPRGPVAGEPTMLWSGTKWYDANTAEQIPTGQWVELTFTVNNGNVVVYIDGVAKYTGTGFPNVFTTDNAVLALGVNLFDDTPFQGKIDEVLIFDKALTEAEVQAL